MAHPPDDASNADIAAAVAIQLLVVGLLLYVVRTAGGQFRAHRHLEAVNRNKAAALATFNRIVTGPSEKEVRTAVAVVLAQAVFSSDDTGFVESANDGVTLLERAASPVIQRVTPQ